MSFIWLDWVAMKEKINIAHALNRGIEFLTTCNLRADGHAYDKSTHTSTIYQYDGCYFHSCSCIRIDPENKKKMQQYRIRKEKTEERNRLLEEAGYRVVIMKECQFKKMVRDDPELRNFVHEWDPTFTNRGRAMGHDRVLEAIRDGDLFGFVSASVHLPSTTKGGMSPQELYSIFPPLFANREIKFEDIGRYSQSSILRTQITEKIRMVLTHYLNQCRLDAVPANKTELLKMLNYIHQTWPTEAFGLAHEL